MTFADANSGRGLQSADVVDNDAAWGRVHDLINKLFPVKTAFHLSDITGLSVSAWQKSLREKRAPSPGALVSLLRSQNGLRFLEALMGTDEFKMMWEEAQIEAERQRIHTERAKRGVRG